MVHTPIHRRETDRDREVNLGPETPTHLFSETLPRITVTPADMISGSRLTDAGRRGEVGSCRPRTVLVVKT